MCACAACVRVCVCMCVHTCMRACACACVCVCDGGDSGTGIEKITHTILCQLCGADLSPDEKVVFGDEQVGREEMLLHRIIDTGQSGVLERTSQCFTILRGEGGGGGGRGRGGEGGRGASIGRGEERVSLKTHEDERSNTERLLTLKTKSS